MRRGQWIFAGLVAVIAIATSVALLNRQQADASRSASMRNLQQWGIALTLYLIDNNNQLPEVGEAPVTAEQPKAWYNALPPYISRKPLADLPPGERPRPGVPSLWVDPSSKPVRAWDDQQFYFHYAMNRALQPEAGQRSFRIYEINKPARVVFLTEVDGYQPGVTPETVAYRHGRKAPHPEAEAYVIFGDAHVERVSKAVLTDDPDNRKSAQAETGLSWFME